MELSIICARISTKEPNNRREPKQETRKSSLSLVESLMTISTSWKANSRIFCAVIQTTFLSNRASPSLLNSSWAITTMARTNSKDSNISLLTFTQATWILDAYLLWNKTEPGKISASLNVSKTSKRNTRNDL
jgi:hypothetical protein